MTRTWLALTLAVALVPGLPAQQSPPSAADTGEAGRLRREIEDRFAQRVQQELRLSQDQTAKLRATEDRFRERRRALMRQQLERRQALEGQMQPGVAANSDSVRKLMDGFQAGRAELLKLEQDVDRDMAGYLTPVQRARYQMMRQRFAERVNEMRQQRRERMGEGGRPGRPGREGGRPPRRRPI